MAAPEEINADMITAHNGYGQNGETIYFNTPITLGSLTLSQDNPYIPTSITVNALDAANNLLQAQTLYPYGTMTFDQINVSSIVFNFTGGTLNAIYNDGRTVAWYQTSPTMFFRHRPRCLGADRVEEEARVVLAFGRLSFLPWMSLRVLFIN